MDSKDFGLEFAGALTGADHLHYGYWDQGLEPKVTNLLKAQDKYTSILIDLINKRAHSMGKKSLKILDVGCGSIPNLALLDEILMRRILPSIHILDEFLRFRSRFIYSIIRFALKKPIKRIKHKYFSGLRTPANFKKFKNYRILVLGLN